MLAAKLLKEKRVKGFKSLDLNDIRDVFSVVGEHYRDARDYPPGDRTWKPAISPRGDRAIAGWGSLGNITAESLAYLYETALIDGAEEKRGRKADDARPTCARRWAFTARPRSSSITCSRRCGRSWTRTSSPTSASSSPRAGTPHSLLRRCATSATSPAWRTARRVTATCANASAGSSSIRSLSEIAKLSLTLADVPHGNTWQIDAGDMFKPGVLRDAAKWATIVLSNPPYEDFKKTSANRYSETDEPVTAQTKAVEMLKRVVPNLAPGAVFGFVLPQGTLYDREAKQLRKELLASCEIAEISLFEDKLFNVADHETCILIGRRKSGEPRVSTVMYRRVRNRGHGGRSSRRWRSRARIG